MNTMVAENVKVEIYSTGLCPYCIRAKKLLDLKGVDYIEYRVDKNPTMRTEMEQRSQRTSVPQIFIGDFHVGGYTDMVKRDQQGELEPLLEQP